MHSDNRYFKPVLLPLCQSTYALPLHFTQISPSTKACPPSSPFADYFWSLIQRWSRREKKAGLLQHVQGVSQTQPISPQAVGWEMVLLMVVEGAGRHRRA